MDRASWKDNAPDGFQPGDFIPSQILDNCLFLRLISVTSVQSIFWQKIYYFVLLFDFWSGAQPSNFNCLKKIQQRHLYPRRPGLAPFSQDGREHIVGNVAMVDTVGSVELRVPIRPLVEVVPHLRRDVLLLQLDEVVPVRPHRC